LDLDFGGGEVEDGKGKNVDDEDEVGSLKNGKQFSNSV
jgi:hypothetical protein